MGLIILIAVGAVLGWLASIATRREASRDILANGAAGVVGAIVGGALSSSVSILGGISASALLVAVISAAIAIVALNLFRNGALASSVND